MSTRVAAQTQFPTGNIFGYTRARALEAIGTQTMLSLRGAPRPARRHRRASRRG